MFCEEGENEHKIEASDMDGVCADAADGRKPDISGCQPTPETEAIAQKQDINEVVEQYDQQDTGTNQSAAADSDSQTQEGRC